eukprot:TRINITY_DN3577_c0_g1_i3.p1 TRINITY_DN3577_c0_g1~~TRINITY_DN3577_c0_g1_i3.p1  ORF type:complete len:260 (-),score=76.70 TRINITY_DN3577_c0_g1_i3:362-1141(-)
MASSMKVVIVCLAFAVLASANIEHEVANERGEVEYRLSFKTRAIETGKPTPTEAKHNMDAASSAKFHVELIGKDGTTGVNELIDHPSMAKSEDGTWKTRPGMVQVVRFKAADVGELKEVKITGDSNDKWSPAWVKINSNDFHTGKGNGIYYASLPHPISKDKPFTASTSETSEISMVDEGHLHKCDAMFCKKAEKRLLAEGDDEPPISHHGGHYGPLGEGMPGTERDETMTRGHFMREFFQMEHVDDDDEDFLRTHSVY